MTTKSKTNYTPPKKSKKPERLLRKHHITLRLNDDELASLTEKSQDYGLGMAVFLRDQILQAPPPVKRIHDLPKVDPELVRQLASIGNNLNQITRLANSQQASYNKVDIKTLHLSLDRITQELQKIQSDYTAK